MIHGILEEKFRFTFGVNKQEVQVMTIKDVFDVIQTNSSLVLIAFIVLVFE